MKKSVATPSEDSKREELLRLLAQTREMEEAKNAAKPVRKLPGALQRALEEDPDIIKKQKSVVPPVSGGAKGNRTLDSPLTMGAEGRERT